MKNIGTNEASSTAGACTPTATTTSPITAASEFAGAVDASPITSASVKPIAPTLTRREVDFAADAAACTLRIAAGQQSGTAQRLAVDHRDGSAIADAVERVHQVRGWDSVHDKADIAEGVAANGELAVEVVGRRRGRQRLQRSERIIEHGPAQVFEVTTVQ